MKHFKMNIDQVNKYSRSVVIMIHCIIEFIIRDISFVILPFIIIFLTNLLINNSIVSVLSGSEFIFAIVIISAAYVIDFTGFNVNVKKRTNNVFFLGLNFAVLLLIINVFFLVIIILKEKGYVTFISDSQVLIINVFLFLISVICKFSIFYEHLSKTINQSEKYFVAKNSFDLVNDISFQTGTIRNILLSIQYDIFSVSSKKISFARKNFNTTKINVENQINGLVEELDKSIIDLQKIKSKLTERKEEILRNCD